MAPSLKELETVPAASNASAPAAPQTKPPSPNDTTARPQPVALEIPVTVNGARTVEGSDKRAPFSESTQTVLVFPHGAVIRIATALAPGQLVFLTNEKSKKEVVCQVIKSKSSGSAGAYVELQFTEPAPGFWGVNLPGTSAPAPRPAAPVAPATPAAPKATAPVVPAPVAVKPPVAAKPIAPTPISVPPAKPVAPPAAPSVVPPAPISSHTAPLVTPPPPSPIAPSEKVAVGAVPPAVAHEPVKTAPVSVVPPAPVVPEPQATPHTPETHLPAGPVPPLRDYSKQIEALFAAPKAPVAPAAPESHSASVSSDPSTEQLKQEAARLQAQLSSMLFTEKPAAAPTAPIASKTAAPIAEISNKMLEAIADAPKAVAPVESKPVPAQRKPAATTLGADEEVKVPSWLAPLQHTETAVPEPAAQPETAAGDSSISVNSEESFDALVTPDALQRPQTAVFGGQLLGEASTAPETGSSRSKKGLLIAIAAALLVVAGGGYYYFHQNGSSPATVRAKGSAEAPVASEPLPTNSVPSAPASSTATAAKSNVPVLTTQPEKNVAPPATTPAVSTSVSMAPSKSPKLAPTNAEPAAEEPKSVMGDVHLAAPVVGHSDTTPPAADALQNIDTKTIPGDSDAFASAAERRAGPAAPLPVGGEVKPAQLVKAVPPVYPALARAQHVSGSVHIDASIDASGNVTAVKIISGPTLLHRAAIDAVKQWKYSPAMLDGEATATHLTITVDFHQQ